MSMPCKRPCCVLLTEITHNDFVLHGGRTFDGIEAGNFVLGVTVVIDGLVL